MNPDLQRLQPYPFEKLAALKGEVAAPPGKTHIALSIGEPKHPTPHFISQEIVKHLATISNYPKTAGLDVLRETISTWLIQRYTLPPNAIDPATQVLPVNGTREALFAFAQCVVDRSRNPLVLMPNPFYQIYEGAALLSGAQPGYLNTLENTNYLPDFSNVSTTTWQRCQLLYLCSPGNPTGAVIDIETYTALIKLADQYDFIIAADECYSELYFDESKPPTGLLEAAHHIGRNRFERCVVFHSLSKRSNVPGLRSGFVAGDAKIISQFLKYRTYHGCAMPIANQLTSVKAWQDEKHVQQNRHLYREKFSTVLDLLRPVLKVTQPAASFYLWVKTPIDDRLFAQQLFATQNVTVLPGSFLSRTENNLNPGSGYVRIALVAPLNECIDAAQRIRHFVENL